MTSERMAFHDDCCKSQGARFSMMAMSECSVSASECGRRCLSECWSASWALPDDCGDDSLMFDRKARQEVCVCVCVLSACVMLGRRALQAMAATHGGRFKL